MATKTAISKIKIESTQTQGETLCLELLENLGIGHKLVSEKHRLYQLEMSGNPLLRCYESLADQRADEKKLEQIADQTKTPVVGMFAPMLSEPPPMYLASVLCRFLWSRLELCSIAGV